MRNRLLSLITFMVIIAFQTKAQHNIKWSNGFKVESEDKQFKLKFGGRIMYDIVLINQSDKLDAKYGEQKLGTEFRRVRFFSSGSIYRNVKYKFNFDFAGAEVSFKDVF